MSGMHWYEHWPQMVNGVNLYSTFLLRQSAVHQPLSISIESNGLSVSCPRTLQHVDGCSRDSNRQPLYQLSHSCRRSEYGPIFLFVYLNFQPSSTRYPGSLIQVPMSEKGKITRGRLGSLSLKKEGERQCFLFSKHLIICTRGSGGKLHLIKVCVHNFTSLRRKSLFCALS